MPEFDGLPPHYTTLSSQFVLRTNNPDPHGYPGFLLWMYPILQLYLFLEWSPGPRADCAASVDRLFGHLSHVDVGPAITMFCFLTEENPLYAGLVLVELHDA